MVHNDWPYVPLGELLTQVRDDVTIADDVLYKQVTVRLHNKGLVLRQEAPGREIKTKRQYRVRAGQVVYSRIDARNGAIGFVPSNLDNAVVSNDFPVFDVKVEKIDPQFLRYYSSTETFLAECQAASAGTTNRRRLKEAHLMQIPVPLPSLDEQRWVVARIEMVAGKIEEAKALQDNAVSISQEIVASTSFRLFSDNSASFPPQPLSDVLSFRNDLVRPGDGTLGSLRFVGLQHIESHTGRRLGEDYVLAEEMAGRKFRFSPGELVYGYLRPYLNKVWVADCEGICSVDQYVLRPRTAIADPDYLACFMRSPVFLEKAIDLTHSLILPRLQSGLLKNIGIPIPPIAEQLRIVRYLGNLQTRVGALRREQEATQAELTAMMPSVLDRAFRGDL